LISTFRHPQGSGNSRGYEAWVTDSGEIYEHGSVIELANCVVRDGEGQPRLAHAAGASEGQEWNALIDQKGMCGPSLSLTADESGARDGDRAEAR